LPGNRQPLIHFASEPIRIVVVLERSYRVVSESREFGIARAVALEPSLEPQVNDIAVKSRVPTLLRKTPPWRQPFTVSVGHAGAGG
jgi:hypothetical protein